MSMSKLSEMAIAINQGEEAELRRLSARATEKFLKDLQRARVRPPSEVRLISGTPRMIVPESGSSCGSPAARCAEQ